MKKGKRMKGREGEGEGEGGFGDWLNTVKEENRRKAERKGSRKEKEEREGDRYQW